MAYHSGGDIDSGVARDCTESSTAYCPKTTETLYDEVNQTRQSIGDRAAYGVNSTTRPDQKETEITNPFESDDQEESNKARKRIGEGSTLRGRPAIRHGEGENEDGTQSDDSTEEDGEKRPRYSIGRLGKLGDISNKLEGHFQRKEDVTALGELVTPSKVNQSSIGDCYFEASLASLAASDSGRKQIIDMIKENKDGSYTVTFPGAKDHPITVTDKDISEAGIGNDARWADVLESAFLKHAHESKPWGDWFRGDDIGPLASVRYTRQAMHLLTGENSMTDQFAFTDLGTGRLTFGRTSKENAREDLEEAIQNDRVVTSHVTPDFLKYIGTRDGGPLPDQHVYSVIGYNAETDKVLVRNPWKNMHGSDLEEPGSTVDGITHKGDGVLEMSFDTFYGRFNNMNISGRGDALANLEHTIDDLGDAAGHVFAGGDDLLHLRPGDALDDFGKLGGDSVDTFNNVAYGTTNWINEVIGESIRHPQRALNPFDPIGTASILLPGIEIENPLDPVSLARKLDGPAKTVIAEGGDILSDGKDLLGDGLGAAGGAIEGGFKKLFG